MKFCTRLNLANYDEPHKLYKRTTLFCAKKGSRRLFINNLDEQKGPSADRRAHVPLPLGE